LVTTIPLAIGAGNTVYDPGSGHIFVAVHEKNELVAIDPQPPRSLALPRDWNRESARIALDVNGRLAFVAGEDNSKLAVVDLTNMRVLATYPVGKDPDVLSFDPGLKRLYVPAESGNVNCIPREWEDVDYPRRLFSCLTRTRFVSTRKRIWFYFPLQKY